MESDNLGEVCLKYGLNAWRNRMPRITLVASAIWHRPSGAMDLLSFHTCSKNVCTNVSNVLGVVAACQILTASAQYHAQRVQCGVPRRPAHRGPLILLIHLAREPVYVQLEAVPDFLCTENKVVAQVLQRVCGGSVGGLAQ